MKICVVKAGSAIVTQSKGKLDLNILQSICEQIIDLSSQGWKVILVSSGSVAAGCWKNIQDIKTSENPIYASIGQSRLIYYYSNFIDASHSNLNVGQILLTREHLADKNNYVQLKNNLIAMLQNNIVPIVNENDALGKSQISFLDNDQLATIIAAMVDAEMMIILSEVGGVFTKNPKLYKDAILLEELDFSNPNQTIEIDDKNVSRGGMKSKLDCFKVMSRLGKRCALLGKSDISSINSVVLKNEKIGTQLKSTQSSSLDSIKTWLLTSAIPKGMIVLSPLGADVIAGRTEKDLRSNLYTIGVVDYFGHFERRDVVSIRDENFNLIGIGRCRYSRADLDSAKCGDVFIHDNEFIRLDIYPFINLDVMHIKKRIKDLGLKSVDIYDKDIYTFLPKNYNPGKDSKSKKDIDPQLMTNINKNDLDKFFTSWKNAKKQFVGIGREEWIIYGAFDGKHTNIEPQLK
jgi:glutamate 5-kinase